MTWTLRKYNPEVSEQWYVCVCTDVPGEFLSRELLMNNPWWYVVACNYCPFESDKFERKIVFVSPGITEFPCLVHGEIYGLIWKTQTLMWKSQSISKISCTYYCVNTQGAQTGVTITFVLREKPFPWNSSTVSFCSRTCLRKRTGSSTRKTDSHEEDLPLPNLTWTAIYLSGCWGHPLSHNSLLSLLLSKGPW